MAEDSQTVNNEILNPLVYATTKHTVIGSRLEYRECERELGMEKGKKKLTIHHGVPLQFYKCIVLET